MTAIMFDSDLRVDQERLLVYDVRQQSVLVFEVHSNAEVCSKLLSINQHTDIRGQPSLIQRLDVSEMSTVYNFGYSPNGTYFVVGGKLGTLKLFKLRDQELVTGHALQIFGQGVQDVRFIEESTEHLRMLLSDATGVISTVTLNIADETPRILSNSRLLQLARGVTKVSQLYTLCAEPDLYSLQFAQYNSTLFLLTFTGGYMSIWSMTGSKVSQLGQLFPTVDNHDRLPRLPLRMCRHTGMCRWAKERLNTLGLLEAKYM